MNKQNRSKPKASLALTTERIRLLTTTELPFAHGGALPTTGSFSMDPCHSSRPACP